MARSIPVLLGFLARLIGLGDVSERIKKVIDGIHAKVDKGIDKVIDWVASKAKGIFVSNAKKGALPDGAPIPEVTFNEEDDGTGETHRISAREEQGKLVPTISSVTQHLDDFLKLAEKNKEFDSKSKAAELAAARKAVSALQKAHRDQVAAKEILAAELAVALALRALLSGIDIKDFDERYKLEGLVATYGSMPKQTGDKLTPDHQPQAALVKYVAGLDYQDPDTNKPAKLFAGTHVEAISKGHADGGVAINLHHNRHVAGLTYGKKVPSGLLSQIDAAANTPGKAPKRRTKVIALVQGQLKLEVDQMKSKVKGKDIYPDLDEFAHKKQQKVEVLIKKIRKQVSEGQDRLAQQDLQAWAK
jgi:hypothetical protein